MLTFGSLFSGIGGLDLGFERAGLRCVFQVEKDEFCRKVLRKHWPDVHQWDDVTTFTGESFERPDVIAGGFPCQDLSLAGRRGGLEGERSGLWWEFARIIRVLRPRYVVIENVPGIAIPVAPGRPAPLGCVLGDLSSLGFDAEWSTVSACALGAPHMRRRLFIIAYPNSFVEPTRFWIQQQYKQKAVSGIDENQCFGSRERWMETITQNSGSYDGLPGGVDRIRALGNAVVPQVAEVVARRLLQIHATLNPEES